MTGNVSLFILVRSHLLLSLLVRGYYTWPTTGLDSMVKTNNGCTGQIYEDKEALLVNHSLSF